MSIDFIQGKSADKVLHFFEKQMSNPEKMTKSEKNVFFWSEKLFDYDNDLRER